VKWNEGKWSAQYREGGEQVFMEKVYGSSKWWEVKDWGESVSELTINSLTLSTQSFTSHHLRLYKTFP